MLCLLKGRKGVSEMSGPGIGGKKKIVVKLMHDGLPIGADVSLGTP